MRPSKFILPFLMTACSFPSAHAEELVWFEDDKLVLTNGATAIEGTSGGGIATWATIAGRESDRGVGVSAHATGIELRDFGWRSHGVAIGYRNRVELSYARQDLHTRRAGEALNIGRGYKINQDVFGVKVRLAGDIVYGDPLLPQISVGVQHKINRDGPVAFAVGAAEDKGTDFTLSATKLVLSRSILVDATARVTKANEGGLLGFGSAAGAGYSLQIEGSAAYQISRRAIIGAEFRTKPDNLQLGEDDWFDLFVAYGLTDNLTVTAAYVDLGSIATLPKQRGGFLSTQLAF